MKILKVLNLFAGKKQAVAAKNTDEELTDLELTEVVGGYTYGEQQDTSWQNGKYMA